MLCFAINAQNVESDQVRAQANKFIKSEFDGEMDARIDMATYNKIIINSENLVGNKENRIISIDHTTIRLVKSYQIQRIEKGVDSWIITIEFEKIAEIYGDEPSRKIEYNPLKELVIYRMIQKQGNWYVYEPPEPRISLGAMIRLMAMAINRDEARQKNKAIPNKPRKETVEYRKTMLNALEKIHESALKNAQTQQ
jgi:hypothetical protein